VHPISDGPLELRLPSPRRLRDAFDGKDLGVTDCIRVKTRRGDTRIWHVEGRQGSAGQEYRNCIIHEGNMKHVVALAGLAAVGLCAGCASTVKRVDVNKGLDAFYTQQRSVDLLSIKGTNMMVLATGVTEFTVSSIIPPLNAIPREPGVLEKALVRHRAGRRLRRRPRRTHRDWSYRPQHFLNFLPLPQGQGSFRPVLGATRMGSDGGG
jgi:hypothetical protein